VNSGRSTREHSIEDTALNTNLEAAEEIARQLRLRDLAGLIVIDFIDMEEKRNNRAVERKLKDCLRADRARIQVGRISHFGLMEMSRQRIRTGVLESSTVPCPHCRGTGQVRSISSLSLQILRALEDQLLRHAGHHLHIRTRPEVALYVLNQKRRHLAELEARFGLTITISGEPPENGAGFSVERGAPVEERPERGGPIVAMPALPEAEEPLEQEEPEEREEGVAAEGRDRRRRRRRRRGNGEDRPEHYRAGGVEEIEEPEDEAELEETGEAEGQGERFARGDEGAQETRRRRRGRRGGRRRGRGREGGDLPRGEEERESPQTFPAGVDFAPADVSEAEAPPFAAGEEVPPVASEPGAGGEAEPERIPEASVATVTAPEQRFEAASPEMPQEGDAKAAEVAALTEAAGAPARNGAQPFEPEAAQPGEVSLPEPAAAEPAPVEPPPEPAQAEPAQPEPVQPQPVEDDRPKRSGWWSRRSLF
jgi:ribonuclease E